MRHTHVRAALLALSLTLPPLLAAQSENPWTIRVRGIAIVPQASSKPKGAWM